MKLVGIYRWPVLTRDVDAKGNVKQAESAYHRTAAPVESRVERLTHLTATRAFVTWGHESGLPMSTEEFLLNGGGRMAGNADWVISKASLKELRRMAREMYPDEPDEAVVEEALPMALAGEPAVSDPQAPEGA